MNIETLEDHVRMMLGRLVLENITLSKQVEDLRAQLLALQAEAINGTAERP